MASLIFTCDIPLEGMLRFLERNTFIAHIGALDNCKNIFEIDECLCIFQWFQCTPRFTQTPCTKIFFFTLFCQFVREAFKISKLLQLTAITKVCKYMTTQQLQNHPLKSPIPLILGSITEKSWKNQIFHCLINKFGCDVLLINKFQWHSCSSICLEES